MGKVVDNLKLVWLKTNRFHQVLILFIILEVQPFPGGKYGFYCKDPALSHPFTGDTISWKWLMSVCGLLPLVVMLIVERAYQNTDKDKPKNRALHWYKEYIFGYIVNLCIVQLLKHIVGSPRPHFFDTCKPKEASSCAESDFVSSYTCTTSSVWNHQSDKSFPSGHTSLAIHAGFFIAYYLHKRVPSPRSAVIKCAQALSVCGALWCAASRLLDHRHHWWDVLAGGCIAAIVLLFTIFRLCENFKCTPKGTITLSRSDSSASSESIISNGETNEVMDIPIDRGTPSKEMDK